jgi:hypothetical protein
MVPSELIGFQKHFDGLFQLPSLAQRAGDIAVHRSNRWVLVLVALAEKVQRLPIPYRSGAGSLLAVGKSSAALDLYQTPSGLPDRRPMGWGAGAARNYPPFSTVPHRHGLGAITEKYKHPGEQFGQFLTHVDAFSFQRLLFPVSQHPAILTTLSRAAHRLLVEVSRLLFPSETERVTIRHPVQCDSAKRCLGFGYFEQIATTAA